MTHRSNPSLFFSPISCDITPPQITAQPWGPVTAPPNCGIAVVYELPGSAPSGIQQQQPFHPPNFLGIPAAIAAAPAYQYNAQTQLSSKQTPLPQIQPPLSQQRMANIARLPVGVPTDLSRDVRQSPSSTRGELPIGLTRANSLHTYRPHHGVAEQPLSSTDRAVADRLVAYREHVRRRRNGDPSLSLSTATSAERLRPMLPGSSVDRSRAPPRNTSAFSPPRMNTKKAQQIHLLRSFSQNAAFDGGNTPLSPQQTPNSPLNHVFSLGPSSPPRIGGQQRIARVPTHYRASRALYAAPAPQAPPSPTSSEEFTPSSTSDACTL